MSRGPTAELLAVGDELLLGDVVDSNSAWLSQRLAELGVQVTRHTSVGDDVAVIAAALRDAIDRSDVVLVTGGLGPTQDDLTRDALAEVAGVPLERDQAVVDRLGEWFASRGYEMTPNNAQQADRPAGADWLAPIGTAPGIAMEVDGTLVCCMPGVPREMEAMVAADVIPLLQRRGGLGTTVSRVVRTSGMGESAISALIAPVVDDVAPLGNPTIAFLASTGEARVKVTARAATREEALALADPVVQRVVALLGEGVVGLDDNGVEADIGRRLLAAGLTVGVVESVTAGAVGARLASVPGASEWFRGGLITYATDAKVDLAGLDGRRLAAEGPVSAWTAEQLALAAVDRTGADLAVSVVGVAGPAEQGGQPVGTIWIGSVGLDGMPRSREVRAAQRSRADVQEYAVAAALAVLHRLVVRTTR